MYKYKLVLIEKLVLIVLLIVYAILVYQRLATFREAFKNRKRKNGIQLDRRYKIYDSSVGAISKPYLFEAMYRLMLDSKCTPLVRARTDISGVVIPEGLSKNNEIILDIAAAKNLAISEHTVTFDASFGEKLCSIRIPMTAIIAIYTAENGMGVEFFKEESEDTPIEPGRKPDLRVL